jgi:hypothetical protein
MLDGRFVLYLLAALLVSGAVGAGLAYWAANAYIVSEHTGDALQTQGGLKPSQNVVEAMAASYLPSVSSFFFASSFIVLMVSLWLLSPVV